MLTLKEGEKLVNAARKAVENYFSKKDFKLNGFKDKKGVFVTLHEYPSHELRGCIGFIEPIFSLNEGLVKVALSAAFSDPRFFPLRKEEMDKVIFEVSVLTMPEVMKGDYVKQIKIGRDGLIAEYKGRRGLLLPIIASEYKWDAKTFLAQTCVKAGLDAGAWKDPNCKIYKFSTQVFSEVKPKGKIEAKDL